jgi:hypothetical protein
MPKRKAPTVGINFVRPLSLPEIERELLNMKAIKGARGELPAEYGPLFGRIQDAWEYYRPTQPQGHQLHIDSLIASVHGGVHAV